MSKYNKIYEQLKDEIIYGEYHPGDLLPPEPQLEMLFNCSRTTIRKAVSLLESEGYVEVKQGRGTTVLETRNVQKLNTITSITETLRSHGHSVTVPAMNIEMISASERVAAQLELEEGSPVYRVERLIYIENIPICIMTNYLNSKMFPGLEQYNNQFTSLYRFLEDIYALKMKDAKERITARSCGFAQSQILHIPTGTPLLFIRRTTCCEQGIFEYCEIDIIASKYEYEINLCGR